MTKRTSVIIIWTPPCLLWKLTKKDFTTEIKYIANHWILLFFFLQPGSRSWKSFYVKLDGLQLDFYNDEQEASKVISFLNISSNLCVTFASFWGQE